MSNPVVIRASNGCTATLYLGDCLQILPTLSRVDALVSDPPYGIAVDTDNSRFSGGTAGNIAKRGNGIGSADGAPVVGDDKPFDPTPLLGIAPVTVLWGWNHYADKLPRGACLVWVKRNDEAFGEFLSDAELAWLSKGHGVYLKRDLSNNAIAKQRVHPTQKPVSLMTWCLSRAGVTPGQTILDPYGGSGSTIIAALRAGCDAIYIEIEPKYFATAERRIRFEAAQAKLFDTPKPKPQEARILFDTPNSTG